MPNSIIGKLAGNAYIVKSDGAIKIANTSSVLDEGDIFISSKFGHGAQLNTHLTNDVDGNTIQIQKQERLTSLALSDDISQILLALQEGEDPTQIEGTETAAGDINASSYIATQSAILSSNEHVQIVAGFTTTAQILSDLPVTQRDSLNRTLFVTLDNPIVLLSGNNVIMEGQSAFYTITLSRAMNIDTTISLIVVHKTSEEEDVIPVTREVVIPAGQTSVIFSIKVLDDIFDERNDNDIFIVSITDTLGGEFEQQPVARNVIETVINDSIFTGPKLTLVGDTNIDEGNAANYTLALSEAPISDLTVDVVVGHKTSEAGDVTSVMRQEVITANTMSTYFTVATFDDSILEINDEDVFEVSVSSTSGGGFEVLPDNPAVVETTINEDTMATDKPTLTLIGDSEVIEGEDANYTLAISEAPISDLTVTVVVGHK
ncbi:immunoglobulin-like domain-containing protein, partial [Candidatus Enterovibrio altilux]|uniref:immunoglobulin-like domain-containing protein n=2 Tax=Candidatus Enterovibrio altilux TaxID=1927128 RepID=UPI002958361C